MNMLTPELRASIVADPIISFYLKMLKANDCNMPTYNDTSLRLAITVVSGSDSAITKIFGDTLLLYRRLLLYYYSENCKTITELHNVMYFVQRSIVEDAFKKVDETINLWYEYIKKHLKHMLGRELFMQIMVEWTKRHRHLIGQPTAQATSHTMQEVKTFLHLRMDVKNLQYEFNQLLERSELPQAADRFASMTLFSLHYKKVLRDIEDETSPLVQKFILSELQYRDCHKLEVLRKRRRKRKTPMSTEVDELMRFETKSSRTWKKKTKLKSQQTGENLDSTVAVEVAETDEGINKESNNIITISDSEDSLGARDEGIGDNCENNADDVKADDDDAVVDANNDDDVDADAVTNNDDDADANADPVDADDDAADADVDPVDADADAELTGVSFVTQLDATQTDWDTMGTRGNASAYPRKISHKQRTSFENFSDFRRIQYLPQHLLLSILHATNENKNMPAVAKQFNISPEKVGLIARFRQDILNEWKYNPNPSKRLSQVDIEYLVGINEVMQEWYRRAIRTTRKITDAEIMAKASELRRLFALYEFEVSARWLKKFKTHLTTMKAGDDKSNNSLDIAVIVEDLKWVLPSSVYAMFMYCMRNAAPAAMPPKSKKSKRCYRAPSDKSLSQLQLQRYNGKKNVIIKKFYKDSALTPTKPKAETAVSNLKQVNCYGFKYTYDAAKGKTIRTYENKKLMNKKHDASADLIMIEVENSASSAENDPVITTTDLANTIESGEDNEDRPPDDIVMKQEMIEVEETTITAQNDRDGNTNADLSLHDELLELFTRSTTTAEDAQDELRAEENNDYGTAYALIDERTDENEQIEAFALIETDWDNEIPQTELKKEFDVVKNETECFSKQKDTARVKQKPVEIDDEGDVEVKPEIKNDSPNFDEANADTNVLVKNEPIDLFEECVDARDGPALPQQVSSDLPNTSTTTESGNDQHKKDANANGADEHVEIGAAEHFTLPSEHETTQDTSAAAPASDTSCDVNIFTIIPLAPIDCPPTNASQPLTNSTNENVHIRVENSVAELQIKAEPTDDDIRQTFLCEQQTKVATAMTDFDVNCDDSVKMEFLPIESDEHVGRGSGIVTNISDAQQAAEHLDKLERFAQRMRDEAVAALVKQLRQCFQENDEAEIEDEGDCTDEER